MSESEENPVIGYYKDGEPIHQNPSEQEIADHIEEWVEASEQEFGIDFTETINEMRDSLIYTEFAKRMYMMKLSDENVIDYAIDTWRNQWPQAVRDFQVYMDTLKSGQFNEKGYNVDDKSMVLFGSIPPHLKALLIAYRHDFFERDSKGRCKNMDKLYSRFKLGKVSSFKTGA